MMQEDMEKASARKAVLNTLLSTARKAEENKTAVPAAPSVTKPKPGPTAQVSNGNTSSAAEFPHPASFDDPFQLSHDYSESNTRETFSRVRNAIGPAASKVLENLKKINDPTNSHH